MTDTRLPMDRLAEKHEGPIADAVETTLRWLKERVGRAVDDADHPAVAVGTLPGAALDQHLSAALQPLGAVAQAGAAAAVQDGQGGDGGPKIIGFSFDQTNPRTTQHLQSYQYGLVREIGQDTVQTIHQAMLAGMAAGQAPDVMARQIKDSIGLTAHQGGIVANYRAALQNLNSTALGYDPETDTFDNYLLRDKRSDSVVRRALWTGQDLDQPTIDSLVDRYQNRFIRFRANTISRTETLRAANLGYQAAVQQNVDQGVYGNVEIRRFWLIAPDEKVCPICVSIPKMNPGGVAMGQPFQSIKGVYDLPPAHPNCRCGLTMGPSYAEA